MVKWTNSSTWSIKKLITNVGQLTYLVKSETVKINKITKIYNP